MKVLLSTIIFELRTIKYHMEEIMNRLHLENRNRVLTFAGQMGLTVNKPVQ